MSWIPSQSGFKKYPLDTGVTDNPALMRLRELEVLEKIAAGTA